MVTSPQFTYSHTVATAAPAAALWALWSDVSTWPEWDEAIDRVELGGPFAVGTEGTMAVRGQDPMPIRIIEVEEGRGFADETAVPDGTIRFRHLVEDGRITHSVEIEGPEPFAQAVGAMITAGIPETMATLVQLAEERS
jgi:hypothetical protein